MIAGTAPLGHSVVAAARDALAAAGARAGDAVWLAARRACDIPFDGMPPFEAAAGVRDVLVGQPFDLVAQPVDGRRKKLLVADMESTIIDNEMIDELAAELGLADRIADLTARTMRGELDFAESLIERVRVLEGLDATAVEKLRANIRVNPGAAELVATMRANGAFCALVSGGFTVYSEYVRELVGFDHDQANQLEVVDGKLTGRVVKPILDRLAKQACLLRLAKDLAIPPGLAVAVGDGANDLAMVLTAGLGVAYHGKPILAETAAMRIDHGDLTALLYAQGYGEQEIVGGSG
ncbi:MAG: phosphoserine phosphatase SerB [Proteobacteria bacterium]|nr:phosphoserine phosphatase SerB [Pseudomonadota bacterium]